MIIAIHHHVNSRAAALGFVFGMALLSTASAADWFAGVGQKCASNLSTTFVSDATLRALVVATDRLGFAGSGNNIRLTYKLLSTDLPNPRTHYRTSVLAVDQRAKADLEGALTRAADKDPLPVIDREVDIVLAIATDGLASFVWSAVYGGAKQALGAKPMSVEGVLPLLAVGGQINRDIVVQRLANKQLWADLFWSYNVSVGSEKRTVVLASCRLPVELTPTTIETKGQFNNKRLTLNGGKWQVYDLEDKKFDSMILEPAGQDEEWIYANEMQAGKIWNQYRFSNSGAGWQTISSGNWKFLYKEITFQ
ncbi:hypothetical protein [Bradyrhizobium ottawaense]|uniref:hypothetical protein n=1 Tax=Bradyrhizobium ottawaense TaxID=931866 RepID=UPI003493340B